MAKKEEQEKKRLEALAKKKERQELESQELKDNLAKLSKANPVKVTQAKIRKAVSRFFFSRESEIGREIDWERRERERGPDGGG